MLSADFAADVGGVSVDDTVRNTYHQKSRDPLFAEFKVSSISSAT